MKEHKQSYKYQGRELKEDSEFSRTTVLRWLCKDGFITLKT